MTRTLTTVWKAFWLPFGFVLRLLGFSPRRPGRTLDVPTWTPPTDNPHQLWRAIEERRASGDPRRHLWQTIEQRRAQEAPQAAGEPATGTQPEPKPSSLAVPVPERGESHHHLWQTLKEHRAQRAERPTTKPQRIARPERAQRGPHRFLPARLANTSGRILVPIAVTIGLLFAAFGAYAYLSNTGTGSNANAANDGALTAASISVGASGGSVTVTWNTQANIPADPALNSDITYTVQRELGSGGFNPIASGGCYHAGGLPDGTGSCTDTVSTSGTYTYEVIANYGSGPSWTATSNQPSVTVNADSTPPTATVTIPANNGSYNSAGWGGGSGAITGTATDSSTGGNGVSAVEVSIENSATGKCWNGTDFTTASCPNYIAVTSGGTATGSNTANWSYSLAASALTNGDSYTVTVEASDTVGNTNASAATATWTYDTTAPTSAITFPANNGGYNATTWAAGCASAGLCGTASDPGANASGVNLVQVSIQRSSDNDYWNGTSWVSSGSTLWENASTSNSWANWSYGLTAANLTDNVSYTVLSQATDKANNTQTTPASNTFVYDTTAPTTSLTFPSGAGPYNASGWNNGCGSGADEICGTATDPNTHASGVNSVTVSIESTSGSTNGDYWTTAGGGGFTSSSEVKLAASTSNAYANWTLAFPTSNFADGTYTVRVYSTDKAGNAQTATTSQSFTIDTTAPSVSVTYPANNGNYNAAGWTAGAPIAGTSSDATSGVASVQVSVQQGNGANSCWIGSGSTFTAACPNYVATGGTTASWTKAFTSADFNGDGAYTVKALATDNAGNTSTATNTFNYDTTAPTVSTEIVATTGTDPVGFVKASGGYIVYANVTDTGSGVNAATITANVSNVTSGDTAIALTACGGCGPSSAYSYESTTLTATGTDTNGNLTYSVSAKDNAGNTGSSSGANVQVDNTGPSVATVIAATTGTDPVGFVTQGGGYRVYANVTDLPSGVGASSGVNAATILADVHTVTTGETAVAFTTTGCPCVVNSISYAYQTATQTANATLSEGSKAYSVSASDNLGNAGSSSGASVTVDNTAPSVATVIAATTGTDPVGFVTQGGGYRVYANVTDLPSGVGASSGVNAATILADVHTVTTGETAVAFTTTGCPCVVNSISYAYQTATQTANATLSEGSKAYSVSASDNLGNAGSSSGASVTVDNTGPSVATVIAATTGTDPVGFVTQGGGYRVYANVTDLPSGVGASSGVNAATILADVHTVTTGETAVAFTTTGCPCVVNSISYAYQTATQTANATLSEGSKAYSVSASDNLGNAGSSSGASVTVDNTGPSVTATLIGQSANAVVNGFVQQNTGFYVYANVSDAGSGVQSVTATLTNVTGSSSAVALVSTSGPFTAPGGGSYTYRSALQTSDATHADTAVTYTVNATDNVGNASTNSGNGSVTFDSTAPTNVLTETTVTGTASLSGATVSYNGAAAGSFTIKNALTDSGSGPQSSTFAALGGTTTGWTFTSSTVSLPAGGPYVSTTFSWAAGTSSAPTELVTGTDKVGNTNTGTTLTFSDTADKLVITSAAVSGAAELSGGDNNLGPITVQLQTPGGSPVNGPVTVNLTGPTGSTFATSQFGTSVTSVSIGSGTSTATFWYGTTNTGTPTITAAATGVISGTQQETITAAPAGLGMIQVGGSGTPVVSCGTVSTDYTCTVTGVGSGGNVTFYMTFVNASGSQVVYSATQASTIAGGGGGEIAANASSSNPTLFTASHSGNSTKTTTMTFGPYTLVVSVSS